MCLQFHAFVLDNNIIKKLCSDNVTLGLLLQKLQC